MTTGGLGSCGRDPAFAGPAKARLDGRQASQYNDANWVTKIILRETATPVNVRQSFEYGYDQVGNRIWVTTGGGDASGETIRRIARKGEMSGSERVNYADGTGDVYQYDATYQVTGVKYGVGNPTVGYASGTGASHAVAYTYDAVGNRSQMVIVGTGTTSYTVNNLNQYSGTGSVFTYDANGNMTGDGSWAYGYDREGHLISASISGTSATYGYDSFGRRMEKNVNGTSTKYVYSGQNLIEERDSSNNVIVKYIYSDRIDTPIKMIKSGTVYYYQQDALGNITAMTDASGAIQESYTYDVFGIPAIKDGGGSPRVHPLQPFLFTGREYDSETRLYHYRTRAYSPELGRFLQPDTINFKGGDVNFYRYVANNPINSTDAFGQWGKFVGKQIGKWLGKKPGDSSDWDMAKHEEGVMVLVNEEEILDAQDCCSYKICHYAGTSGGHGSEGGGSTSTNSTSVGCDDRCPDTNGWAGFGFGPPRPPFPNINNTGAPTLR